MKKLFFLLVLLPLVALADVPFRTHRYESFKALETNPQSIVFAGNSITNMHEWWEAFGSHPEIVNRGNSGGYTQEIIDNLESYLTGRPAKLFLMIGTNDLGTAGKNSVNYVAGNIRAIAKRVVKESPTTKLYIECILPSNNGIRNNALTQQVNDSLKGICKEFPTVEYVDLWNTLYPMGNMDGTLGKKTNSYDNLHPNAWGYSQWCHQIAPLVGYDCSYPTPDKVQLFNGGFNDSWGSRISQFTSLPTTAEDVLIIGEEMIHGGEWHELLHSANVKGRGTGWGFGDNLNRVKNTIDPMFTGYDGVSKVEPAKIFLSLGIGQIATGNTSAQQVCTNVTEVVDKVIAKCPNAQLYIMGCHPFTNAGANSRVEQYNNLLKTLCTEKNATYVDIYTTLDASCLNSGNYLGAKGYARVSQVLAQYIDGATATTDQEVADRLALYNSRNALGSKISALELFSKSAVGTSAGQLPQAAIDAFLPTLNEAYDLLAKDPTTVTEADLTAMATRLDQAKATAAEQLVGPTMSSEGHYVWYALQSQRGNRYVRSQGVGQALTGVEALANAATEWCFMPRQDGTFDIISRQDGGYISPASAANSALTLTATQPTAAWQYVYSGTDDYFDIYSGTSAQFNQTGTAQSFAIYNWYGSTCPNLTDEGCHYRFVEIEETDNLDLPEPEPSPYTPVLTLRNITSDGTAPYKLTDEEKQKIFDIGEGAMTVAIDFTVATPQTGSGAFNAHALICTAGQDATAEYTEFFSIAIRNGGAVYGLEYLGETNHQIGWYTGSGVAFNNKRSTVIIAMDPTTGYYYLYHDGAYSRNVGPKSAFGQYGFRTLSTIPGQHDIYLLGAVNNKGVNRFLTSGTIHSLRVYDQVIPQADALTLDFSDTAVGISALAPAAAEGKVYDLSGRRVSAPRRGLYIMDGRKVAVK